jgi:hypothetical protein
MKNTGSGKKIFLRSAEALVPIINWFVFLINVADICMKKVKKSFARNGYKHGDAIFWQVLVHREMTRLSIKEAANDLNDELWRQKLEGRGRKPHGPRKLGGNYPRRDRLAPNESQMHSFLKKMPGWVKKKLSRMIFKAQIDLARKMGLLKKEIEVYIDYTNKDYYGKDRFPSNPYITGTNKGAGTSRMRKYCALMISSGTTRLFAGVFLTRKGRSKVPGIAGALAMLDRWGFTIKKIFGDREFSTYDFIGKLNSLGYCYTGTMKKTVPIKEIIMKYLKGLGKSVVLHVLNPCAKVRVNYGPLNVHVILKADPGMRIRDVQRDYMSGKITLKEACKKIHVFITTEPAPRDEKHWGAWGAKIVQPFRKRWRIETGFRDTDIFTSTSHARENGTKTFMFALDMFAYNAWQMQRALRRRLRRVPRTWRIGPTRERFSRLSSDVFLAGKNSTAVFVDLENLSEVATV